MTDTISYRDMMVMFGPYYKMPPEAEFAKGVEIEYRCPYHSKCPAKARCFAAVASVPLQDEVILNVQCRLCGRKIPVYASEATIISKK